MAQILLPIADQAAGSWSNTPLWSKVDDDSTVNPSGDGTSISSESVGNNTATSFADLQLAAGSDPSSSTGHILRARWNHNQSGRSMDAHLELWQGVPGSGTQIASLDVTPDVGTTETESTYTLSAGEADSISDYSNLYLRIWGFGSSGGPGRNLIVDLVEFEVPDGGPATGRLEASWAEVEAPTTPTADFVGSEFVDDPVGDTNMTIPKPSGVQDGDVMVAFIAHESGSAANWTGPSGWTQLGTVRTQAEVNHQSTTWWKTAGPSEPADYTWISDLLNQWHGGIVAYRNRDVSPIDAHNETADANQVDPSLGISTTVNDCILVEFFAYEPAAAETYSSLDGMREVHMDRPSGLLVGAWDEEVGAADLYIRQVDYSGTDDDHSGHLIALAPSAAATGRLEVSWVEVENPDTPSRVEASWVEVEAPDAPGRLEVSWVEVEAPHTPSRVEASWTELEAPHTASRIDVSWVEFESPDTPSRLESSWVEVETPHSPSRVETSWTEVETPEPPGRLEVSWIEVEAPDPSGRIEASWTELEVPSLTAEGRLETSWVVLEVSDTPSRVEASWTELETPHSASRIEASWVEFETEDTPSRIEASWVEVEAPHAPSRVDSSWAVFEVPSTVDEGRIEASWVELETPDGPARLEASWVEFQVPSLGGGEKLLLLGVG